MRKAINALSWALNLLAGVGLFYLIFGTVVDVMLRQFNDRGYPPIVEYAPLVLVALLFLSLAHTQRLDQHVAVDSVAMRLPRRLSAALEAAGLTLVAVILALVFMQVYDTAVHAYVVNERREGLTQALVWPARWAMVVGLSALVLQLVVRIGDLAIAAVRGPTERRVPAAPHSDDEIAELIAAKAL